MAKGLEETPCMMLLMGILAQTPDLEKGWYNNNKSIPHIPLPWLVVIAVVADASFYA